jgi:hypothetical protein
MKRKYNRWIMGSAIGIAAIAAAVDHTRHRLQTPQTDQTKAAQQETSTSPCGLTANPCGLNIPSSE